MKKRILHKPKNWRPPKSYSHKKEKPIKRVSLAHTKQFHKKKHKIGAVILSKVDDSEIIYGARALNVRFPKYLDRHTTDYDIFTNQPKRNAMESEKALDKEFGGDFFHTEAAQHEGTYKVKAHANQEGYADYTKPDDDIPYEKIRGKKYIDLDYMEKHTEKTLKDPEASYRHAKDRDALNRIRIYKKLKGR